MGLLGFAVDVGVNIGVSRVMPGVGGLLVGGAAGGFAGKLADNAWEDGIGIHTFDGAFEAGAHGAVASMVVGGAGHGLSKLGGRGSTYLTDKLKPFERAKAQAADYRKQGSSLSAHADELEAKLKNWPKKKNGADKNTVNVNGQTFTKKQAAAAAKDARKKAGAKYAGSNRIGQARNLHKATETSLRTSKKVTDFLNDKMRMGTSTKDVNTGHRTRTKAGWANSGLTGLGAAAWVHLGPAGNDGGGSDGSGEQGGNKQPSAPALVLQWVGDTAAGPKMGTKPFVEEPGVTDTGAGFLLQPVEGIDPAVAEWHGGATDSVAKVIVDDYELFGNLEKKEDLQLTPLPKAPHIPGEAGTSEGTASYSDLKAAFDEKRNRLVTSQANIAVGIDEMEEITKTGQESFANLITGMNHWVKGLTQVDNAGFLEMLIQAVDEAASEIENANAQAQALAEQMKEEAERLEDDEKAREDLGNSVDAFDDQFQNPAYWPDNSQGNLTDPAGVGDLGVGDLETPGTATSDLADSVQQAQDRANEALEAANNPSSSIDPASSVNPYSSMPATDPMGGMSGMMGSLMNSLLPMMMSQAAMRNGADNDMARRINDIDPSRYDQAAAPTMPQARPAATTPWSNQAAATPAQTPAQPAHTQTGPPPGATSTQTGTGAPKRVAGADGLVLYPFPDGRTQKVPLTVALALDKAFANNNGTDAKAAYAGTPAAWTDPKDIGPAVDPFQLATGDVATWTAAVADEGKVPAGASAVVGTPAGGTPEGERKSTESPDKAGAADSGSPKGDSDNRTALLVVFGEGESGTVEAVVHGELQQFAPDMGDAEGPLGDFAGFKHPKGVEAGADNGQEGDTVANADQPVDVPVPA
ncbi:hypothetical protein [Nocardia sp. CA-290969]|uniref:hypothetical protein n=1 Tax=Nocardia sp. CA-290969 TaxID=3239986 RepID=UPI003D8A3844